MPLSIQSIPREVIDDTNADRLSDVIRFATGANTGNAFGNTDDNFLFRGFSAQVVTDGIASNALNPTLRQRDSVNLERVEVLRGPASALYGQGAPGGVINLVRKRPFDTAAARFNTSVSSLIRLRQEADINLPLSKAGEINARFVGAVECSDSFTLREFTGALPENRVVLAPSLSFSPTPRTDVVIRAEYVRDASFFDRGIPIAEDGSFLTDIDLTFADTSVGATIMQSILANAEVTHSLSDAVSLRMVGGVDYKDFEGTQSESSFLSPIDVPASITALFGFSDPIVADNSILRTLISRSFENVNINLQVDANLSFSTGPLDHQALISEEYAHANENDVLFSSDFLTDIDVTSITTPNLPGPLSENDLALVSDNETTTEAIGLIAFDKVSWGDRLHVLLGGRPVPLGSLRHRRRLIEGRGGVE
ncbi:MAG: TonB-dependent receptor plug domain-containing protein [Pseudomonadota bacterium]